MKFMIFAVISLFVSSTAFAEPNGDNKPQKPTVTTVAPTAQTAVTPTPAKGTEMLGPNATKGVETIGPVAKSATSNSDAKLAGGCEDWDCRKGKTNSPAAKPNKSLKKGKPNTKVNKVTTNVDTSKVKVACADWDCRKGKANSPAAKVVTTEKALAKRDNN